jgi:hypothetical protein
MYILPDIDNDIKSGNIEYTKHVKSIRNRNMKFKYA